MKKLMGLLMICFLSFAQAQDSKIKWLTIEEADEQFAKTPNKQVFMDFYTDWCGWCKKMDQSTFMQPEVIKFINDNYIAVKFDAESKEDVVFRGKVYKYVKASNGRGVNSFAYFSLKGKMSYPSYAVIKNGETERILIGFMDKDRLIEGLITKS